MVRHTLESSKAHKALVPKITLVDSRRGKQLRADPVVALYEKEKVWHISEDPDLEGVTRTNLSELEAEQTEWVPGEGDSPNRVDALVHGVTAVAKRVMPTEIADPSDLTDWHGPSPSLGWGGAA
jgi:phage terminase large subunit-like protein